MPAGADLAHRLDAPAPLRRRAAAAGTRRPSPGDRRRAPSSRTRPADPPSIQPAPCIRKFDAAHDRAPEREHALVGRLGVERIGGVGVRRAIGQTKAAGELPADDRGFHVFGRAERRRARFHVDVRGEAAIDEWRAGPHDLGHDEAGERLGMLLGEGARKRDRGHRAGEGERGQHHDLIAPRHLDDPLQHRRIKSQRRRRVDDREQRGLALERLVVDAARDLDHLDRVQDCARVRGCRHGSACRTA